MANLTISVNDSDKKEFGEFCDQVGISSSSLLNMFIKTVIREGRIPFEISVNKSEKPNRRTIRAMKEGDDLLVAEDAPLSDSK
nr:type II toxin-antitoxin system RelB/DinJ family antitoxin [uncultured Treponema sp.]